MSMLSSDTLMRTLLRRLVRVGTVDAVASDGTVTVELRDLDGVKTWRCFVLVRGTHVDKEYWSPQEGDRVVVLALPHGTVEGFILGTFYNDADGVPSGAGKRKRIMAFDDGTRIEYDAGSHTLHIDVKQGGTVTIEGEGKTIIRGGNVDIDGGGALEKVLTTPKALSDFTGKPIIPGSSTVRATR